MDKDIQKLTQNERYDLKRKQVMGEMEAYNSEFSDWCQLFGFDSKKVMEKYFHDIAINSDEYKKLEAENQRLKAQLDREIKINRKMKRALEKYANSGYWFVSTEFDGDCVFLHPDYNGYELAQQVLKEIDNKE